MLAPGAVARTGPEPKHADPQRDPSLGTAQARLPRRSRPRRRDRHDLTVPAAMNTGLDRYRGRRRTRQRLPQQRPCLLDRLG